MIAGVNRKEMEVVGKRRRGERSEPREEGGGGGNNREVMLTIDVAGVR
jgi:hypothetical protein